MTHNINLRNPMNRDHPLNRGISTWLLNLPTVDGGNSIYNLAGYSNGTLTNLTSTGGWRPTTRPGGFGHLQFDGTDDYVLLPKEVFSPLSGLNTITLTTWFLTSNIGSISLVDVRDRFDARQLIFNGSSTTQMFIIIGGTGGTLTLSPGISNNVWTNLTATLDGTNMKIYINGILANTTANTATMGGNGLTNPGQWGSSSIDPNGGNNHIGSLDDLAIYTRTLSASEVFARYSLSRLGFGDMLNRISLPMFKQNSGLLRRRRKMLAA